MFSMKPVRISGDNADISAQLVSFNSTRFVNIHLSKEISLK